MRLSRSEQSLSTITKMTSSHIRPAWQRVVSDPIILVSVLAIALAIPRFIWLLNDRYNLIIGIFLVMWILPFLTLTKEGRTSIGIRRPQHLKWLPIAFFIGIGGAIAIHFIGYGLYGSSDQNWYVTIMNSFNKNDLIADVKPNPGIFLLITFPSMIFSPIGEEFFFRGMIHDSFASEYGQGKASLIDGTFFGITHLAHHGLFYSTSGMSFHLSGIPWALLMLLVSLLLSWMRKKSESIWGAVVCHAGFNLGMMFSIVYLLHE